MIKLKHIKFTNYKCFEKEHILEIRPITIVIGKNSSGKSALSRLPLLLSNSFSKDALQPLAIQIADIEFGGSFIDLVHNRFEHGSITFELCFVDEKGEDLIISFVVQNFHDSPIQIIKTWEFKSGQTQVRMELDFSRYTPHSFKDLKYVYSNGEQGVPVIVNFKGVLPTKIINEENNQLIKIVDGIDTLIESLHVWASTVNYLGPFRAFPNRVYKHSGTTPPKIGTKGEFSPQILGMSDYLGTQLVNNVSNWYQENLGGWKLDLNNDINSFEIVLVNPNSPTVKVNIVDVGQGMSQILPLIVRCFYEFDVEPSIDIIEQPELHLHPAAHSQLSQLLVETAIKRDTNFIIETHSENIILRIRRLIVEGVLNEKDVIIYWVNDEIVEGELISRIEINKEGELSDWPEGVFSEDYTEILAIRKALRK